MKPLLYLSGPMTGLPDDDMSDLEKLARDLLDPESLGYAATPEIRDRARLALGIAPCEFKPLMLAQAEQPKAFELPAPDGFCTLCGYSHEVGPLCRAAAADREQQRDEQPKAEPVAAFSVNEWAQIKAGRAAMASPAVGHLPSDTLVYTAPPVPAVPEPMSEANRWDEALNGYARGWNACRDAMLAESPKPPAPPSPAVPETWKPLLEAVLREMPHASRHRKPGNAPGHAHDVPGIWDSDNGELAGKHCAWCIAWNTAVAMLAAAPEPKS